MSQVWNEEGRVVPVTKVLCGPNVVKGFRTVEKDGYSAMIVKADKKIQELRKFPADLKESDTITVANFSKGDVVRAIGTSKGKGFQGVVKRHNFSGGGKTHGHRHDLRKGGSIGGAFPQHVLKGKRMAGRMGSDRVTVKNLRVVEIDESQGILYILGAVPGRRGSIVALIS